MGGFEIIMILLMILFSLLLIFRGIYLFGIKKGMLEAAKGNQKYKLVELKDGSREWIYNFDPLLHGDLKILKD